MKYIVLLKIKLLKNKVIYMKEKEKLLRKILFKELEMVIIDEEKITNLDFDCRDEELNDFIYKDALNHLYENLAVTYLCLLDDIVVGFVSISNASIKINKEHKKKMKFQYPEFPSARIGRVAIDKKYNGKGIGSCIIKWVFGKCEDIGEDIGIRFVSVDAYDESIMFYEKNGFHLFKSNKRNKPMYFDLNEIEMIK